MKYYPIGLNLSGKKTLVVGAGAVAQRKVRTLLRFGAQVKVIAPSATSYLAKLSRQGNITWIKRAYRPQDIKGAGLVVAATSDRETNRKVSLDAGKSGIWVNVVDDTSSCEFISPAIIKKGGLVISISSDGRKPRLSKEFKDFLKGKLDEFNFNRHQL